MNATTIPNWDSAVKVSEKMGSSPGGMYLSPDGKNYYVKFSGQKNDDRIANEYLANTIYQHMGLPVPQVYIVTINGNHAHASEFLERDEMIDFSTLKNGFVVDAFLANWDIVSHLSEPIETNIISHKGILFRIDNGGALLFRARGERKTPEQFNETVVELKTMRDSYSGLCNEDVKTQIQLLEKNLTDNAIDVLVDNTPLLQRSEKDFLKDILKKRRYYILQHASLIY